MEPNIVYQDKTIIVCHKPAGTATETGRLGQQDMVSLLKNYRAQRGEPPCICVVHRLDQPVEGLLVFAKTQRAAAELSGQVRERGLGKHYCALGQCADGQEIPRVCGTEAKAQDGQSGPGSRVYLTDYIIEDKKNNRAEIVPENTPGAKRAELEYRVIGRQGETVCFDISLHTGRRHQIRAQMAHQGFPLIGDSKYGGVRAPLLALCAYRLTLRHPEDGRKLDFVIEPHNPAFAPFLVPVHSTSQP